ncbi:MAG: hypothetical protein K8T10_12895 [Candidatus Eremiobacteraeota bacterium]|nr:hypothetical protein [Candidatus Eremiobacteraeota bacterium]
MAKNTSLKNREFGYQFSGTEYKLIFEKENIGFVRFFGRSTKIFYLDPSRFLNSPKSELYILENCSSPKKGELIEVSVLQVDTKMLENNGYFSKQIIKYVSNWKKVNPNKIVPRKVLHPYEFQDFFKHPFIGDNEYIDNMSFCFSLYAVSCPQISINEKGGLNAALLGKDKQWGAFKKIMNVIPREFRQISSNNFYKLLDRETIINPVDSTEVSLAYYNPSSMPVQIPAALDVENKPVSQYKSDIEYEIPIVRAHILDSLLYQPKIPSKLDSYVANCVYDLVDDIKQSGFVPYNQDLGSVIPKLSSSFARLNFDITTTKEDITRGVDLWSDMFRHAKKTASTQLDISKLYSLSGNAKQLYIDLNLAYGVDVSIDIEDAKKNSKLHEWNIEDALMELSLKGAIYYPDIKHVKILDFKFKL